MAKGERFQHQCRIHGGSDGSCAEETVGQNLYLLSLIGGFSSFNRCGFFKGELSLAGLFFILLTGFHGCLLFAEIYSPDEKCDTFSVAESKYTRDEERS